MCDATNVTPRDPRRFSIRLPRPLWIGLAATVLVVAAAALHLGMPIYRQHVCIREIERVGGVALTFPRGPEWLRDRVGDERMRLFEDVVEVQIIVKPATEETLRHVGELTSLQRLYLDGTPVTDDWLVHLKGLSRLEKLSLRNTPVTDAGLRHLKELTQLRW
ncbi:MAG: hypothetical protein ACM3U2_24565, partial [Deltaproteobacteria bacterium]